MLVRLLYASRAIAVIDAAMLESVLAASVRNNADRGITGVLCAYQNGHLFLQALEGARDEVNRLYNTIVQDPRHSGVMLLHYEEITERAFSSWRMGRVDLNRVNIGTIMRYSPYHTLDPFQLSGRTALALLLELSTTTTVLSRN